MKWTSETPTRPGWYWYKLPRWEHGFIAQIYSYRIGLDRERLWAVHITNDEVYRELLAEMVKSGAAHGQDGWLWAGPIPEPEAKQ